VGGQISLRVEQNVEIDEELKRNWVLFRRGPGFGKIPKK